MGQVIKQELARFNDKAGSKLFQHVQIYEHPECGTLTELGVNTSKYIDSKVWVAGTSFTQLAALSLDIIDGTQCTLGGNWGDKVDLSTEGVISIATGRSPQELFQRFHQTSTYQKHDFISYRTVRNLYRALPFVVDQIRKELVQREKSAGVIWFPSDFNPRTFFAKQFRHKIEERDGENLIIVEAS